MRLTGKTALITGAARGIGAVIARRFVEEGAAVCVGDIDETEGQRTAAELAASAASVFFVRLDVTSEESWKAAYAETLKRFGRLDVLVNNAGVSIRKDIEQMPVESLDAMLAVNVKGPFLGIKHVLPIMRAAGGGVILNMASVCGLVGHRYTSEAYTASKGAVTLLTRSIASRYARDSIRCNAVNPSTVETDLVRKLLEDPERRAERLGEVPLGRLATAIDVANAFVYLASEEAAFINGVALPVDGGVTAW